jgi:hypothetical protein
MENGSLLNAWTMSKGNNCLRYSNYEKRIKNKKKEIIANINIKTYLRLSKEKDKGNGQFLRTILFI